LGLSLGKKLAFLGAQNHPQYIDDKLVAFFLKSRFSLFALSYNISNKKLQEGLSFREYFLLDCHPI